jgi:peptide/nickel transport system ATP-binding protein
MGHILDVRDLKIDFATEQGVHHAINGVSFQLDAGETLGIVGESGSGKSVTSLCVMRLLAEPPARIASGEINYRQSAEHQNINIAALPLDQVRAIRGSEIAMIFQEPMTSLNPVFRCGHQVTEAIQLHQKISYHAAKSLAIKLFEQVKLPDPERIFNAYPHQISGGQKQRVMIAMAMSCQPAILIADEPTTALDVTVQKTILELMRDLKKESGLSMIFISHDLGVISEICDRVIVMYQGQIVEQGLVKEVLNSPKHAYTKGLVACRPSLKHKLYRLPTVADFLEGKGFEAKVISHENTLQRREKLYGTTPLLKVENLSVRYPAKSNWLGQTIEWLKAVDEVSFEVFPGETFGLAGESGCGKTTLGRSIAKLLQAHSGSITYKGTDLLPLREREMKPFRREIQVVFQDPMASLNPKMTIGAAITEPMKVHNLHENDRDRKGKAIALLETVGLQADFFHRYPHQFSGGQRQRICIARALALEPKFLICDESVSALDVSVQATVLNLLMDLQEKFGLTYLFISHDLSVIKQMCDRMMIMQKGKVEALGFPEDIFESPENDYVKNLIRAIPGQ